LQRLEAGAYPTIAANSSEFAAFFLLRNTFGRQKRSFFARGPGERLRSFDETASYGIELCCRFAWGGDARLQGEGLV
jgi:hypothetical protein